MEQMVKKIFFAIIMIIATIVIWIYLSFCRFCQISIDTDTNPKTWNDTIFHIQDVAKHYSKTMFLYKGLKFENLHCKELNKKNKLHTTDIKFNWDNTITCIIDNKQYLFEVDSVNIATSCYTPFDTITWEHGSEDSLFYMISFYDKNKNMIEISRQKPMLPYGGKRCGFKIKIGKLNVTTRNTSPFDY